MKKIIHIAPALPPVINGLGDFCQILANNLAKEGYDNNIFMVRKAPSASNDHRNICSFTPQNFDRLLSKHKADVVVLHYVGYAYNRNGIPFYLVSALRAYKRDVRCRVLVFFHELYATSRSVFKLPFYTGGFQRLIVRELCGLADAIFTNCEQYNERLKKVLHDDTFNAICTGIFSNVPDDLYDDQVPKEEGSLVVFGSYHRRKAVFENPLLLSVLENLKIRSIYDIGPGETHFGNRCLNFYSMGSLEPGDLAVYLNKMKYGALNYEAHLLGKSGIFSAYAAFGVIPINLFPVDYSLTDGLEDGKNYFSWSRTCYPELFMDGTARKELVKWYNTHNQEAVANKIKMHLA